VAERMNGATTVISMGRHSVYSSPSDRSVSWFIILCCDTLTAAIECVVVDAASDVRQFGFYCCSEIIRASMSRKTVLTR
jgi:hypothetical protein